MGGRPAREPATVTIGERTEELHPGDIFTFGRAAACTVTLDPSDRGISRLAGPVEHTDGTWFVINRSQTRPLSVIDPLGFRTALAPGRRMAVDRRLSVVVEGQIRRHELVVTAVAGGEDGRALDLDAADEIETEMGRSVT
jgi:hypothetical protein